MTSHNKYLKKEKKVDKVLEDDIVDLDEDTDTYEDENEYDSEYDSEDLYTDEDTDADDSDDTDEFNASIFSLEEPLSKEEQTTTDYSVDEKSDFLRDIDIQINKKKQLMLSKLYFLDKTKKENEYLEGVRKDYEKYRKYIAHTKQQEMNAMIMLKSYIDDIILNGNIINADIANAKLEKARILKEINKIKRELNAIVAIK